MLFYYLNNSFFKKIKKKNKKKKNNKKMEQMNGIIIEQFKNPNISNEKISLFPNSQNEELENPKIKKLNDETNSLFKSESKKTSIGNFLKKLVSQNKNRFIIDEFDLDLTYITKKIIAMGLPSTSLESLYRNNITDVQNFFKKKHNNHHKVYNLCDDKKYDNNIFYKQATFPFKDHESPPLNLIYKFCNDAKNFLLENDLNVVAIHCKAGKGRTGCFTCCLLLYLKYFDNAYDCIKYYGIRRTDDGKGLTVPSQIRYVYYWEKICNDNNIIQFPIKFPTLFIFNIKLSSVPKIKNFSPLFIIENYNDDGIVVRNYCYNQNKFFNNNEFYCEFVLKKFEVCGDVRICFYHKSIVKDDFIFKVWVNTYFLPKKGTYIIKKDMIDIACKDINNNIYDNSFGIEISVDDQK